MTAREQIVEVRKHLDECERRLNVGDMLRQPGDEYGLALAQHAMLSAWRRVRHATATEIDVGRLPDMLTHVPSVNVVAPICDRSGFVERPVNGRVRCGGCEASWGAPTGEFWRLPNHPIGVAAGSEVASVVFGTIDRDPKVDELFKKQYETTPEQKAAPSCEHTTRVVVHGQERCKNCDQDLTNVPLAATLAAYAWSDKTAAHDRLRNELVKADAETSIIYFMVPDDKK